METKDYHSYPLGSVSPKELSKIYKGDLNLRRIHYLSLGRYRFQSADSQTAGGAGSYHEPELVYTRYFEAQKYITKINTTLESNDIRFSNEPYVVIPKTNDPFYLTWNSIIPAFDLLCEIITTGDRLSEIIKVEQKLTLFQSPEYIRSYIFEKLDRIYENIML